MINIIFCGPLETLELRSEEDSRADTTNDDMIKSEIFDNAITQTVSATTFSVTSSNSSDSDDSSSTSGEDDDQKHHELPSHLDNDESSKQLISDESSYQPEDEIIDDQPVTQDLTLTKTVELTEYDPDPEPEEVKIAEPESEQNNCAVEDKSEVVQPIEMFRQVEEFHDVKEMSLNNFESTMDDISDAELESLEQELEDLVAIAEQSVENITSEIAVESLMDSLEKTSDIISETPQPVAFELPLAEIVDVPEKQVETPTEPSVIEVIDDPSEIQEACALSEVEGDQRESSLSEAQEAVEPTEQSVIPADPDPVLSTSSTDESTSIQNLPSQSNEDFSVNESNSTGSLTSAPDLGRVPPYWIPDNMTNQCMQCDLKFSLIKRRHHCRSCGLLLCSGCCSEKFFLHYLGSEGRICGGCHETLVKTQQQQQNQPRNPNPANPMEYCSTLPPQQQVSAGSTLPPTVMVPSGVLKRGPRSSERKSVIFSDGIRPGTDLDETTVSANSRATPEKPPKFNMPTYNEKTNSFIPETANELPPVLLKESEFKFVDNDLDLLKRLRQEELKFAINKNFFVTVKIVTCK